MALAAITEGNLAGGRVAEEFAAVVEHLRRATVEVRGRREPGGGSGVIWRPDGVIVTNAHVARGPHLLVDLWDGRTLEATLVDRDIQRDLAVLSVSAAGLPAVDAADSDGLRVGELVLAVGNPMGVTRAATAGIVHAIGHADARDGRHHWVQADVRLAPGNSGGPLANARGHVIGINSMINGGLALAVPSNDVESFLRRGDRPFLGVVLHPVAVTYQDASVAGLLVIEVAAGSPAETAGIMIGDVLVGTNGNLFRHVHDLNAALYGAGATLVVDAVRGGQHITREVALAGDRNRAPTAEVEAA